MLNVLGKRYCDTIIHVNVVKVVVFIYLWPTLILVYVYFRYGHNQQVTTSCTRCMEVERVCKDRGKIWDVPIQAV